MDMVIENFSLGSVNGERKSLSASSQEFVPVNPDNSLKKKRDKTLARNSCVTQQCFSLIKGFLKLELHDFVSKVTSLRESIATIEKLGFGVKSLLKEWSKNHYYLVMSMEKKKSEETIQL